LRRCVLGLLGVLALLASGNPVRAQGAAPEPRKSMAVLSALGDRVQSLHVGLMVFQNDFGGRTVDCNVDGAIAERVAQILGTRFEMRQVAYAPPPLAEAALDVWSTDSIPDLSKALRATVKPGAADLLLVVTPRKRVDPLQNSKAVSQGLGVYTVQNMFRGRHFGHVYLICAMTLFDGHTLQKIDEDRCQNDSFFGGVQVPHRKIDESIYKTRLEDLSPDQLARLRAEVMPMLDETVKLTLAELKLTASAKADKPAPERPPQEESTR
jgi:hypothetical protein